MRYLICDIRRLFGRRATLALCILAPVAVMLLFSSIAAPMIFTGRGLCYSLAVFEEDKSPEVRAFIFQMTHSEAMSGLVRLYRVDSLESGLALLERQEVSVVLHIPPDVLADIRQQKTVRIPIISSPEHALEQSLIVMSLGQSLMLVGQGQNQMEAARRIIIGKGISSGDADLFLTEMTFGALLEYMGRRQVLGESGTLSPLDDYLPVQYYLAAIFALFAAFAMLPLIHFTANDLSGAIWRRGLACGRHFLGFYFSRLLAGTMFILLVLLMVFPTTWMLEISKTFIGSAYRGSLSALFLAILLTAVCFSALASALAAWIGKVSPALWTGFYAALGMSVACGAIIPHGSLPGWLAQAGRWLPLRSAMRGLSSSLFSFDKDIFSQDMLKLTGTAVILILLGIWGTARRERSA